MRLLGVFLTACVVLAAIQALAAALALALLIALAYALMVQPKATLGFIALGIIAGLAQRHPIPFLSCAALAATMGCWKKQG